MIGLAMGISRSPVCFWPSGEWPALYKQFRIETPPPPELSTETATVRTEYANRIEAAYRLLNQQLREYEPDAILLIGDDNMEVFGKAFQPSLSMFVGSEIWGYTRLVRGQTPDESQRFELRCNPELATYLLNGLVERDFDFAWSDSLAGLGRSEIGIGHAFTSAVVKVLDGLDVPVIPLTQNVRHQPILSARRCYQLGRAIADVFDRRDERIAVITTGGLSVLTIDQALDRWVLGQIQAGNQTNLSNLFIVDSNNVRGETGEIRNWITMSATMDGCKGVIVDYLPVYHGIAGLAFAYLTP